MADHNTLIGSTGREIESGTVLIGGVVREIESGLVLVNGVSREIEFAKKLIMTITGSGNSSNCYVRVGGSSGTKYYNAATVEIDPGTSLYFYSKTTACIYLNGSAVTSGSSYNYTPTTNLTVELKVDPRGPTSIKITTQ